VQVADTEVQSSRVKNIYRRRQYKRQDTREAVRAGINGLKL